MIRLVTVCLAAMAICNVLSGCGGSTTAVAVPHAVAASSPVTRAQAAHYAHVVNLKAGDLPGMSVTSPEREARRPGRADREADRCAANVNPDLRVAKINSAKFVGAAEAQHEQIYSNVEVMPTVALAAQNNAANRSQRALSCAARFIPQLLGKSSGTRVHYGPVTITRLPSPLPGVRGSFGFRIAIAILGVPAAIEPTTPHLYFDSLGFLSGEAEVALIAVAFPQPVSEEVDARLMSLLHSRAEAHRL
jgi:hypothetical protein